MKGIMETAEIEISAVCLHTKDCVPHLILCFYKGKRFIFLANPSFKVVEFDHFKQEAGLHTFLEKKDGIFNGHLMRYHIYIEEKIRHV